MDPHIIERRSERGNKGESDSSSKEEEELTIEAKRSRIPRPDMVVDHVRPREVVAGWKGKLQLMCLLNKFHSLVMHQHG